MLSRRLLPKWQRVMGDAVHAKRDHNRVEKRHPNHDKDRRDPIARSAKVRFPRHQYRPVNARLGSHPLSRETASQSLCRWSNHSR